MAATASRSATWGATVGRSVRMASATVTSCQRDCGVSRSSAKLICWAIGSTRFPWLTVINTKRADRVIHLTHLWSVVVVAATLAAVALRRRLGGRAAANPVLLASASVLLAVLVANVSRVDFTEGTRPFRNRLAPRPWLLPFRWHISSATAAGGIAAMLSQPPWAGSSWRSL
jgi:hypothetical protein